MKTLKHIAILTLFYSLPSFAADTPNDAEIAAIVVAANQVDINAGELAQSMSTNPKIQQFADMMVKDHTSVNKSAVALVTKLKVTPEANPTSKSLTDGGIKNIAHLKTLSGKEFDKAYTDHEVTYHEQVLDAIDTLLIPNAKNEELKALLIKVRPAFVTHLEHAKHIQAELN